MKAKSSAYIKDALWMIPMICRIIARVLLGTKYQQLSASSRESLEFDAGNDEVYL